MIASILQLWSPTLFRFAGLARGHNCKIDAIMVRGSVRGPLPDVRVAKLVGSLKQP
jgi:hypothetical protein